jgi:hypothetical protein
MSELQNEKSNHYKTNTEHIQHSSDHRYINSRENKSFKATHHRTKSETACLNSKILSNNNRATGNLKLTIGDLMSGKAFDNNCLCIEKLNKNCNSVIHAENMNQQVNNTEKENNKLSSVISEMSDQTDDKHILLDDKDCVCTKTHEDAHLHTTKNNNEFDCFCNAPRLAPELEFTKTLVSIGKKLVRLSSRELKSNLFTSYYTRLLYIYILYSSSKINV